LLVFCAIALVVRWHSVVFSFCVAEEERLGERENSGNGELYGLLASRGGDRLGLGGTS
jgi:hypothetical protein